MTAPEIAMRRWVEEAVVGLDLCPFARKVVRGERLRYVTSPAAALSDLLPVAHAELLALADPEAPFSTTLVLAPAFVEFERFLDGLDLFDGLVVELELEGVIQVASFHPQYRFADAEPEALGNYTNRAPVPAWHLLREADLAEAIAGHPDPEGIPSRNIARLEALGLAALRRLLRG